MAKITYTDKVNNTTSELPSINKVGAADLNEIKNSVNAIYDDKGGFVNYEDTATSITPIVLSADTWTPLTNNKLGAHTNESYKPSYVDNDLWNSATNKIDLSDVPVGKVVMFKCDFEITQTHNNTIIEARLSGGGHDVHFFNSEIKVASGSHHFCQTTMFYVEDVAMQTAGLSVEVKAERDSEMEVHQFMITII